ncbi:hypothetical protein Q3G72_004294 [Acer saccharum]|nr:hypothetical protein Q3G72_004294 [Acer saccharum]
MHGNEGCLEKERIALLAIKPFIINAAVLFYGDHEDDHNRTVESWVDDKASNCCDWYRVECSTTTGRVMNLSLSGLLYKSTTILNFSLFQPLEQLQILDLSYNSFEGWVDSRAHHLKQLKILNLGGNRFNCGILSYLTTITSLMTLILNFSNLKDFNPTQGGGLWNLRNLEYLGLSGTSINVSLQELGNIQADVFYLLVNGGGLANLRNLEVLDLSSNIMSGSLQPANLRNLKFLDLSHNGMIGSLQELGICKFKNLIELDLSENNFEGHLPPCVNNLTILRALDLSSNQLTGNIPSLNLLTSLEYLSLRDNNFEGLFSFGSLANLSKLEIFQLSTKDSTLQVLETENFLQPPSQLKVLYLTKCNLHGIPSFLMYQHSLEFIDLSNNKLVGMFPTWLLQNNTRLQGLYLINNSLSRILLLPNSTHDLLELRISSNNLNGQLPMNITVILPRLVHLDLSENWFSGSLESSLILSSSVMKLCLQKNALNGSIPNAFLGSSELLILDLRDNEFSGSIPNQIDEHSNLRFLLLGGNHLEGIIPHELCKFKYLGLLDLSRNRLSGTIPLCFTDILLWVVESDARYRISLEFGLAMEDKGYSGSSYNFTVAFKQVDYLAEFTKETEIRFASKNRYESYEGKILYYMLGIDLSSNELTGDIPTEIGYLQEIIAMNLSRNSLSGSIPESFSNLTNIESLDLSYNKLSGRIPPQLTQLNSLSTFNVSFNNLSGPVPDTRQFGTFIESSYGGNPGLCGPQIKRSCGSSEPTTPPATPSGAREDQEDESAIHMVSFYWSLFASYVTTILGFVLILWLNSYWRKQWFCFIDACIISSYCWILRNIFHRKQQLKCRRFGNEKSKEGMSRFSGLKVGIKSWIFGDEFYIEGISRGVCAKIASLGVKQQKCWSRAEVDVAVALKSNEVKIRDIRCGGFALKDSKNVQPTAISLLEKFDVQGSL